MKVISIKFILLLTLLFLFSITEAQDYNHSVKVKPLSGFGVSYKRLTDFEKGYEFVFAKNRNGYNLTVLRVFQQPAFPHKSDKWFVCYGFGTHVSTYDSYSVYNPFRPFDPARKYNRSFVAPGFDGCSGLEYRFLKHPFTLNIDYNLNFEFMGPDYFRVNNYITLGIAVVF